jgi:spore coat protein U-like protein
VQLDVPIGLGATGSASATIYGRAFGSQGSAPPGSYASAFSGAEVNFLYSILNLFDCTNILSIGPLTAAASFNVLASVASNCTVSAQNLNFGTRGVLNTNTDLNGQVSVTCTSGTAYTIGLNGGNANATPGARKLSKAAETITYALYQNSGRTQLWGDTINTDTQAGSGSGAAQTYPVYGRVPAQSTPTAGTYTDTVIVTLTY